MKIEYGSGPTKFGPGVEITLSGNEVATAIHAYLTAHGVNITGPRTVLVNGQLCGPSSVYVDPSGAVYCDGKVWSGKGPK